MFSCGVVDERPATYRQFDGPVRSDDFRRRAPDN
jgi:hypothetical protein